MANSLLVVVGCFVLSLLPTSRAYTWSFARTPQQCGNLSISISGSDGIPPYRVLIIPFGPTPLANAVEARKILGVPFPSTSNKVEFQLPYPKDSQFVAVVSDASGFGSGGTSVTAQVTGSTDSSCFDSKTSVSPAFFFSIDPPNQIVQCQDARLYWDPSQVSGNPTFQGIIPGGQSFSVPSSSIAAVTGLGTGFTWKPSLRSGTTLILVAGDVRGNGTGGSILNVVSAGTNPDSSCLSNNSPSSTPGSPAGGSYPTGSGGWVGQNGASGSSSHLGLILGVVLGVLALLVACVSLVWVYYLRKKRTKREKERPVDLMYAEDDDYRDDGAPGNGAAVQRPASRLNELPEFYQPEPYMITDPASTDADGRTSTNRSTYASGDGRTMSTYTRVTTPDLYSGSVGGGETVLSGSATTPGGQRRKGGAPRPLRPVNIIQHDDAGPSIPPESGGEPEMIELPPAYTALKGGKQPPQQQ